MFWLPGHMALKPTRPERTPGNTRYSSKLQQSGPHATPAAAERTQGNMCYSSMLQQSVSQATNVEAQGYSKADARQQMPQLIGTEDLTSGNSKCCSSELQAEWTPCNSCYSRADAILERNMCCSCTNTRDTSLVQQPRFTLLEPIFPPYSSQSPN